MFTIITSQERINAVFNREDPIDRLPRFEIGAVTKPLIKMLTHYYILPSFLKKPLRSLNLIQEIISYLKKFYLGIELNHFKPKKRFKILPKRLLTNFINLSKSEDNFEKIILTVFKVPIRLGYDGWGFPEPLVLNYLGKVMRRDTDECGICFVDGKVWDLDLDTGDMCEVGLLYEDSKGERMMEFFSNFMKNFDFEYHYGAIERGLDQKFGNSLLKECIVPIIFMRGLMSTWLYAFPLHRMDLLFKCVYEEFRNKGEPGIYGKFLNKKTEFLIKHVGYMAKLGLPALLLGDDQSDSHGPYFRVPIYQKVFKPLYSRLTQYAHSKNIHVFLHSDGRFKTNKPDEPENEGWEFIDDCIIDMGIDAWHSLEMKSNNIYEIKKHVGRKLSLFGSIDTTWLQYYSPEKVRRLVYQHLKGFLKPEVGLHGFVPGTDNSIINSTRIESWLSMIRTIDDFSKKYIKK